MDPRNAGAIRLLTALLALITVAFVGAFGYALIEGWPLFDGLYMTVITIATVGYNETHPLSHQGRTFTIFLILLGSGVMLYAISALTAFIVEGTLGDFFKRIKMEKKIGALKGHHIICGMSGTGRYAIDELLKTGMDFVVIELDPHKISELEKRGILYVLGDATSDAALKDAGIPRAAGLISALHSDADNLLVVLTARELNRELRIIAKADHEESEHKLRKVGADGVVMPSFIGGLRMASELIRPSVVTFLDTMLRGLDRAVRVEEIPIEQHSTVAGRTLEESGLLGTEGVSVLALVRGKEPYRFNPRPSQRLEPGDCLIVMGFSILIGEVRSRLSPASVPA